MEDDQQQHRRSVKQQSHSHWRDKLREDARRLVRERRQQTLQRHRQSLSPITAAALQSALQDDVHAAVQDALHGMQAPQPATSGDDTSVGHSSNSGRLYPLPVAGPIAADADAFLAELEQQIVAEMLEELEQLEAFEAAEIAAAVADREALVAAGTCSPAAAASSSPAQQPGGQPSEGGGSALLCPVCMGAFLLQRAGVVVCPKGCLQLNLAAESLSLGDLRARLEQVYEEHRATGCGGTLAFRMEDLFGTRSLTSICNGGCQHYRIVA